jgi:hypothetical protein
MNAKNARELAIQSARIEIESIELQIIHESEQSITHIVLKAISEAAIAYFKDNGYKMDTKEINISQERTVTGITRIEW